MTCSDKKVTMIARVIAKKAAIGRRQMRELYGGRSVAFIYFDLRMVLPKDAPATGRLGSIK